MSEIRHGLARLGFRVTYILIQIPSLPFFSDTREPNQMSKPGEIQLEKYSPVVTSIHTENALTLPYHFREFGRPRALGLYGPDLTELVVVLDYHGFSLGCHRLGRSNACQGGTCTGCWRRRGRRAK